MKASPLNEVRDMYESNADSYSQMMDKEIELPIYEDVLGRLHRCIADLPGPLLDTACGSGHMLDMYKSKFDSDRSLIGVDISRRMVTIAKNRLGKEASVLVGDMRKIPEIDTGSVVAIINFFAIHHIDIEGLRTAMIEWHRVLAQKGCLLLAAWEGSGAIDYGEESDIIALRYNMTELTEIAEMVGFRIDRCEVEPVEGFTMDAIYLDCKKQ